LLSDSANCTVLRAVVLTQNRHVTDRQTDGIAIACNASIAARCKELGQLALLAPRCKGQQSYVQCS